MWARQKRKLDDACRPHRDVRNRAPSVHGANIFPSNEIVEARDYRYPAFGELSFLLKPLRC